MMSNSTPETDDLSSKSDDQRPLSSLDQWIIQSDRVIRSLFGTINHETRPSPAKDEQEPNLSKSEKNHIAGLMRVNHTGEVCAQGLYNGQAATAHLENIESMMKAAAAEEIDHLAWCENRLAELNSQPSRLNPLWYGMSFGLGAVAGLAGDRWSLGFVAETERQVCKHLDRHIQQIPHKDTKSLKIIHQMRIDEEAHANHAIHAGANTLPNPIKFTMRALSKVMTTIAYRF